MNTRTSFILCATDFSPPASQAATAAAKIATQRRVKLRLVHATEALSANIVELLKSRLDAEVARLQTNSLKVEPILLNDSAPSEGLVAYIRKELPGLVVVGCGVKGAVDRWALGSFSERVAESSPVPTLVVRNAAAFEAWDWVKDRLRVLLALDFHASSDVVLRWAKQFQLAGPCDFVACHVNWRLPTSEESIVAATAPVNSDAVQRRLERDLRKKVRDQIGDDAMPTIVRPYFGDPGACIVEIAVEQKAHVIAVGAHQRHGLRRFAQFSVSREVLHESSINVICVPVTARFDPREAHIPDFRRVLVATDFSELGNSAIPYACAACSIGGLVKIIHVASPRGLAKRRGGNGESPGLREQLHALIPDEIGARCQPPEVEVLEDSNVASAICAEAHHFGADAVCLASHGLGASRAFHGSVTKAVLKRLRLPLLVVRRPDE